VGVRLEKALEAPRREQAAEARGLVAPPALRLSPPAPTNSGAPRQDAVATFTVPPAASIVPDAPPLEEDEKPSTVSGKDPETDVDFVELKNLPTVMGQAEDLTEPARDVNMIDELGVPVPDAVAAPAPAPEAAVEPSSDK